MRTVLSSGEIEELCSSYCAVYHCEAALNGSVLYEQINMTQCLTVPQSLTNTHRHTHSCSAHSVCVCVCVCVCVSSGDVSCVTPDAV